VGIRIVGKKDDLNLVNVYFPGGTDKQDLTFFNKIDQGENWILLGDFNAEHPAWSTRTNISNQTKKLAIPLLNAVRQNGYHILNDGSATHVPAPRTKDGVVIQQNCTAIDLAFSSNSLAPFCYWDILDDLGNSDHFMICITAQFSPEPTEVAEHEHFAWSKANWPMFRGCLLGCNTQALKIITALEEKEITQDILDQAYTDLHKLLMDALHSAVPTVKTSSKRQLPSNPWWNEDCARTVKIKNDALKAWNISKKKKCPPDIIKGYFDAYKHAKCEANRAVSLAKCTYFAETVENEITEPKDIGPLWTHVRNMKKRFGQPDAVINVNKRRLKTLAEKADTFLKVFGDVNNTEFLPEANREYRSQNEVPIYVDLSPEGNQTTINRVFSLHELKLTIDNIKKISSSAGSDPISYRVIKQLAPTFADILVKFYNICWHYGLVPSSWKSADVVPISKQGKSRSDPKNYRPISLTPHLGKLYERMIKSRLEYFCDKNNIIPIFQAGFRKHRSVTDHTVKLSAHVRKAISWRHAVVGTFFDIYRAFDSVWHNKLLAKLSNMGIQGRLLAFVKSFLQDRKMRVRYRGHFSDYRGIDMGVPQGSVIAPMLFSLMISDMNSLATPGYSLSCFADDIALWRTYKGNISSIGKKRKSENWFKGYQNVVDKLTRYLYINGFELSPEKCSFVIFGRQRIGKARSYFKVNINGVPISCSDHVKFLGVVFHQRLEWTLHVNHVLRKAKKKLPVLTILKREKWAGPGRTLINVAIALVRSILLYGAECYNELRPYLLKRLTTVDVSALRTALDLPRHSSHEKTYFEAGVLPLKNNILLSSAKYVCRGKSIPNSMDTELDEETLSTFIKVKKSIPDLQSIHDFTKVLLDTDLVNFNKMEVRLPPPIPPWELLRAEYFYNYTEYTKTHEPQLAMNEAKRLLNTYFQNHLIAYTDGSRITFDRVGAAFYIPEMNLARSASLQPGNSNYTAELIAIYMVIEFFTSMGRLPLRLCIATDCRGALVALEGGRCSERKNLINELLINISSIIARGCDVAFAWVPSHVGIRGNEKADHAAQQAALGLDYNATFEPGLTVQECGTLLTEKSWTLWSKEYFHEASNKGWFIQTFPVKKLDIPIRGQARGLLHRLRTNAWRFKHVDCAKNCHCGQILGIHHLLLSCPLRTALSNQLKDILNFLELPIKVESLLNPNPKNGWALPKTVLEIFYKDPQGHLF
jgi:ribonuclease HI